MSNQVTFTKGIEISQSTDGTFDFIVTKSMASKIIPISEVRRISEENTGVQRYLNDVRANSIKDFCERNEAIFPTPIIVSLNTDFLLDNEKSEDIILNLSEDMVSEFGKPFSVIDGQHRLEGIKRYRESGGDKDFELPIIIYKDADQATSASIFVTINANQRQVDSSTISQLFGIIYDQNSESYTVESFASRVVNILNDSEVSPFNLKIKMLGKKENPNQFISQGTIAKKIIQRITSNPMKDNLYIEKNSPRTLTPNNKKIFRQLFSENNAAEVAKLLIVFFSAFELAYPKIWSNNKLLLKKSIGFSSMMKLYDRLFEKGLTSFDSILQLFNNFEDKSEIESELKKIFSPDKGSSESVANVIAMKLFELYKI